MSRCFPYPPPGYAGKCASNEALILSIKLQRESEKAKSDRKRERRREKKEKRREKRARTTADSEKKKRAEEKLWEDDRCKILGKGGCIPSRQEVEPEQAEKSSLTEEHRRTCNSLDSTENNVRSRRPPLPPNRSKIIRIRLSSKKQGDTTTSSDKEQLCSTSGRTDFLLHQKKEAVTNQSPNIRHLTSLTSSSTAVHLAPKPDKAAAPSLQDKSETEIPDHAASSSRYQKLQGMGAKYRKLIDNWVPPLLQCEPPADLDDQDWLFGTKERGHGTAKRLKDADDLPCRETAALQPRASYLHDVGIYALPFTIPF
ncbi:hypothetical protein Nepgr_018397 [Nepenthes gracilis]|uniref:Uncharacterized protein n=1 Tax=Nepenthes gracilis TaxID=150966 RepID=A0AAD3STL2_NEPGR|nr:hypothetical protein Nepgr_018397 [Nepenthes gracilis]